MRAQLVVAVGLTASLTTVGSLLEPRLVTPREATAHLGETVRLQGTVQAVDPGRTVTAVTLHDEGASVRVLLRDRPPPALGAHVRVTGDLAAGESGPILWASTLPTILSAPDPAPRALADLLERAPDLAGQALATVARWDPDTHTLQGSAGELDARWFAPEPGDQPVLAWGSLIYDAEHASYRLDVTGWRPWTQPVV